MHRSITNKRRSFREKFLPGSSTMKNVLSKAEEPKVEEGDAVVPEKVSSASIDETRTKVLWLWTKYHLIHPSSGRKMKWDGVLAITILYSVIVTPYRIGFDDPATGGAEILDICIDIFFGFDVIVNFNTCYLDPEDDSLIHNRWAIAKNYFKTWFIIDFASTFPIDRIIETFVGGGGNLRSLKMIRFLRLIRLLKLLRLLKLSKFVKGDGLEQNMSINPSLIKLFKLLFVMVFLAHLIACFFYFIAYDPETDPSNPKFIPGKEMKVSWITKYATNYDHGVAIHDKAEQYIIALYWTVVTMTAVGYGDVTATNDAERMFSIMAQVMGAGIFGFVIGDTSSMLEAMDLQGLVSKEKMNDTKEYMRDRKLPLGLQRRVRMYYQYYLKRKSIFDEETILADVSEGLRSKVVEEISRELVTKVRYFNGEDPGFVTDVFTQLNPIFYTHGELLVRQGQLARQMFFVEKGAIEEFVTYLANFREVACGKDRGLKDQGGQGGSNAGSNAGALSSSAAAGAQLDGSNPQAGSANLSNLAEANSGGGNAGAPERATQPAGAAAAGEAVVVASSSSFASAAGAAQQPPKVNTEAQHEGMLPHARKRLAIHKGGKVYSASLGANGPFVPLKLLASLTRAPEAGDHQNPAAAGGRGAGQVEWRDLPLSVHQEGSHLGELSLLDLASNIQLSSFMACQHSNLFTLSKDTLLDLLNKWPESQPKLHYFKQPRLLVMKGAEILVEKLAGGEMESVRLESGLVELSSGRVYSGEEEKAEREPPRGTFSSRIRGTGGARVAPVEQAPAGAAVANTADSSAVSSNTEKVQETLENVVMRLLRDEKNTILSSEDVKGNSVLAGLSMPATPVGTANVNLRHAALSDAVLTRERTSTREDITAGNRCPISDLPEDLMPRVTTRPTVITQLTDVPPPQSAAEVKARRSASLADSPEGKGCSPSIRKGASDEPKHGLPLRPSKLNVRANTVTPVSRPRGNERKVDTDTGPQRGERKKTFISMSRDESGILSALDISASQRGEITNSWREGSFGMTTFINACCCPGIVIDPSSDFRVRWDILVGALVVYSVLIIPLRFGFSVSYCFHEAPFVFDCFVDTFFVIDILLNFNTAYDSLSKELVTDKAKICRKYLRGWFAVDFFSTMPIDVIAEAALTGGKCSSEAEGGGGGLATIKLIRIIRLVRLLKLARVMKLGKLIAVLEDEMDVSPTLIRLSKLAFQMAFIAHFMSCVWIYLYTSAPSGSYTNWVENAGLTENGMASQYLACLYWAFTTISTTGYGDIVPTTCTL
jgi:hypothetical protein